MSPMPTPEELLELYTDTVLRIDQETANKQALIDQVIPQEVKDRIAEINDEFDPILAGLQTMKKTVEDQLRYEVVNSGVKKVQGNTFTATLVKGRTTWDTKILDGMVALVPQIEVARKTGDPSVRITANRG